MLSNMGYRDPLQAALARAESLEGQLAQLSASASQDQAELNRLREQLDAARGDVARLRARLPDSPQHARRPFMTIIWVGVAFAVATAVAGYFSERIGMTMSYLAAPVLAGGIGGAIGAGSGRTRGWTVGVVTAVVATVALVAFFEGIWPSL